MRKIVVSEFITLDGVIQAPGGAEEDTDGGFSQGGWFMPYWHDALGEHFAQVIGGGDTLLLGRKTWEIHGAAFEPLADDDPEEPGFNAKPKYVVSTTLTSADAWRNSTIISDNVIDEIRALKAREGANILTDGSSVLVHTLAEADLIDEYYLILCPVVLGSGKRLFPAGTRQNLRLVDANPIPSGAVVMHYLVEHPE